MFTPGNRKCVCEAILFIILQRNQESSALCMCLKIRARRVGVKTRERAKDKSDCGGLFSLTPVSCY